MKRKATAYCNYGTSESYEQQVTSSPDFDTEFQPYVCLSVA